MLNVEFWVWGKEKEKEKQKEKEKEKEKEKQKQKQKEKEKECQHPTFNIQHSLLCHQNVVLVNQHFFNRYKRNEWKCFALEVKSLFNHSPYPPSTVFLYLIKNQFDENLFPCPHVFAVVCCF
jgi:hypothetical protein